MATLQEIWDARTNVCLVAYRVGTLRYVSLSGESLQQIRERAIDDGLTQSDLDATDWTQGQVVSGQAPDEPDYGRCVGFLPP